MISKHEKGKNITGSGFWSARSHYLNQYWNIGDKGLSESMLANINDIIWHHQDTMNEADKLSVFHISSTYASSGFPKRTTIMEHMWQQVPWVPL